MKQFCIISFRFKITVTSGADVLKIDNKIQEIESNDVIISNWLFTPPSPGKYTGEVLCCFTDFNYHESLTIPFIGECEYGHLKVLVISYLCHHLFNQ